MNPNIIGCSKYTPPAAEELEVYYKVIPGQAQTFNQPGIAPEIDICDIYIYGKEISGRTYNALVMNRTSLENEIAEHLRYERGYK